MDFIITKYEISSPRVREPFTCALITDLHSKCYGNDNEPLLSAVRSEAPDLILCAGDLIVGRPSSSFRTSLSFMERLTDIAPVYFSNGNHETQYRRCAKPRYASFITKMRQAGVHVINNKKEFLQLGGNNVLIAGLEVSLEKYIKFRKPSCSLAYIENKIGDIRMSGESPSSDEIFTILMAHNPEFFKTYGEWGADLTVSGHYHGGVVRSPFTGRALLSPYGYPFPKFGVGIKELSEDRYIIASAGLGDHSIPLRIFDPRELVVIRVTPKR